MLRLIEKAMIAWAEGARRAGLLVIVLFLVGAGLAAYWAANHLKVNTDTSEMLDPDLPFQKNAAALRDAFPQIKTDLVIIARAPTLDEADAFAAALRARLLSRPEVISSVFAPAEEPFFQENGLLYLDEGELESRLTQMSKAASLIETLIKSPSADTLFQTLADNDALAEKSDLGKETLQSIYAELAAVLEASAKGEARPFSWMGALDTDEPGTEGHIRLVYATPVLDFTRLQPAKPALAAIRAEVAALEAEFADHVDVFVTGDPALRAEELESVTTGIGLSFLLSFVLVAILLVVCYRSIALSLVTMAALVMTLMLTSGFAAAAIGELNLVSIAFTVLLVGLGLDFAIHLLLHLQEHRGHGKDVPAALRGAMHDVGPGLVLAGITTSLAFFSFIPTAFDGIAQLGAIAGVGVLIALLVSATFVPAMLGVFPGILRAQTFKPRRENGPLAWLTTPVAVATVLLGIGALFFLPQARFDADPMSLRNPDSPSVQGFNLLFSDTDTIPYRLSRLVGSAEEAQRAADAAKALPTVRATRSLPDFVPEDQDAKLELIDFASGSLLFAFEAEPGEAGAPATEGAKALGERLAAAYTGGPAADLAAALAPLAAPGADPALQQRVQENIFRFFPQLIDRLRAQMGAAPVALEDLPEVLSARYRSGDGQWRVDILPEEDVRDPAALARFVAEVEAAFPDVSGGALQTRRAGQIISASMLEATAIALGIITIILWMLVQRPWSVFLMLFPLALAASLTTAAGVVFDIPFNYANVIVLPLLLGIGVDSGIHLVLRDQHARHGDDVMNTSTPRAVLFSALTTVASFGSLMLSPHRGTASMGELLSIAIGFTLLCTLMVLPAAFRLRRKSA